MKKLFVALMLLVSMTIQAQLPNSFKIEECVVSIGTTLDKYKVIPKEEFESINTIEIKKDEYSRLMNIYFKQKNSVYL